jgi:hypothetical protein
MKKAEEYYTKILAENHFLFFYVRHSLPPNRLSQNSSSRKESDALPQLISPKAEGGDSHCVDHTQDETNVDDSVSTPPTLAAHRPACNSPA